MQRVEQGLLLKFPRKNRLTKQYEFKAVFSSPHKILFKYLMIKYQFNQTTHSRLGIIIGKHFVHRATERNHIRRVLKESFRHQQELMKGLDIVVVMRSKCSPLREARLKKSRRKKVEGREASNQILRNDVNNLWHHLLAALKKV